MPTIAIADGIKRQMFYDDHAPAHFHAALGGDEVLIAIGSLDVIGGSLPVARLRRVLGWVGDHQDALALNRIKCQEGRAPGGI